MGSEAVRPPLRWRVPQNCLQWSVWTRLKLGAWRSSQDWNQCSHMGCWHYKQRFSPTPRCHHPPWLVSPHLTFISGLSFFSHPVYIFFLFSLDIKLCFSPCVFWPLAVLLLLHLLLEVAQTLNSQNSTHELC